MARLTVILTFLSFTIVQNEISERPLVLEGTFSVEFASAIVPAHLPMSCNSLNSSMLVTNETLLKNIS